MKLLEDTKNKRTKNENVENVPNLEIIEVVFRLVNFQIYRPQTFIFLKAFNSEFTYTEV